MIWHVEECREYNFFFQKYSQNRRGQNLKSTCESILMADEIIEIRYILSTIY